MLRKILSLAIIICFSLNSFGPIPQAHADLVLGLPAPGTMVNLTPAYVPVIVKGLRVHPENPVLFDFLVDTGNSGLSANNAQLKIESEKLIKYFLASLTIPDDDLWVNLSPYEKDRIIPDQLGQTEMGRDMLAEDYILKQLTASLIYPEKNLGKEFWNKVYAKAQEQYGTSQIPVNTFNKVWIVADKAKVYVHDNTAFVVASHLKVMLEEDYLSLNKHFTQNHTSTIASQIIRQIVLPQLEEEVNTGKSFANLRQIFHSMILAAWYKKNLKEALLNQVYSNKSKINGVDLADKTVKERIYQEYLQAYKKGVFNYIKDDIQNGQSVPRKYFSGGLKIDAAQATEMVGIADENVQHFAPEGDFLDIAVETLEAGSGNNTMPIDWSKATNAAMAANKKILDVIRREVVNDDKPLILRMEEALNQNGNSFELKKVGLPLDLPLQFSQIYEIDKNSNLAKEPIEIPIEKYLKMQRDSVFRNTEYLFTYSEESGAKVYGYMIFDATGSYIYLLMNYYEMSSLSNERLIQVLGQMDSSDSVAKLLLGKYEVEILAVIKRLLSSSQASDLNSQILVADYLSRVPELRSQASVLSILIELYKELEGKQNESNEQRIPIIRGALLNIFKNVQSEVMRGSIQETGVLSHYMNDPDVLEWFNRQSLKSKVTSNVKEKAKPKNWKLTLAYMGFGLTSLIVIFQGLEYLAYSNSVNDEILRVREAAAHMDFNKTSEFPMHEGDTFDTVAARTGVSADVLEKYNVSGNDSPASTFWGSREILPMVVPGVSKKTIRFNAEGETREDLADDIFGSTAYSQRILATPSDTAEQYFAPYEKDYQSGPVSITIFVTDNQWKKIQIRLASLNRFNKNKYNFMVDKAMKAPSSNSQIKKSNLENLALGGIVVAFISSMLYFSYVSAKIKGKNEAYINETQAILKKNGHLNNYVYHMHDGDTFARVAAGTGASEALLRQFNHFEPNFNTHGKPILIPDESAIRIRFLNHGESREDLYGELLAGWQRADSRRILMDQGSEGLVPFVNDFDGRTKEIIIIGDRGAIKYVQSVLKNMAYDKTSYGEVYYDFGWPKKPVNLSSFDVNTPNKVDPNGGIDLRNMRLDLAGQRISMIFDPTTIAQFRRGDFSGVMPVILRITPILNLMPLLGFKTNSEGLAKV